MDTVLLADASKTIRALARLNLSGAGVSLLTAENGPQALEVFRAERPRVVIADAMLPEIDGYQLCRLVRERDPATRFVLMAPDYLPVDGALAEEVGVDANLTKPFDRQSLTAALGQTPGGEPRGAKPVPAAGPRRASAPEPPPAAAGIDEERLATLVSERVADMLPDLVREILPAALATALAELPPSVAATLTETMEPVIWKTVPALAEQLIKEEIARLTDEVEER